MVEGQGRQSNEGGPTGSGTQPEVTSSTTN